MDYKIRNNTPQGYFDIKTVFGNRKIFEDEIEGYKNPILFTDKNTDSILLDNISDGFELLNRHINEENKIGIIVDCDVDGYTSAALMYLYITRCTGTAKNIKYYIHEGKVHGASDLVDRLKADEIELLIIPDASSNEHNVHKELSQYMDILVIDHHVCDKGYSPYAVVINNQLSKHFSNKALSGVGVVYKFLQYCEEQFRKIDEWHDDIDLTQYLDLVAIGMIADSMDIDSHESRYIIHEGLNNINNPLFKTMIRKNEFSLGSAALFMRLVPQQVSFTIAPLMNAMIRVGSYENKILMFEAMIGVGYDEVFSRVWRGTEYIEKIDEWVARECGNAKNRQSKLRDNADTIFAKSLEQEMLPSCYLKICNSSILWFNVKEHLDGVDNLNGVIAIKIAQKYNKPTFIGSYKTRPNELGEVTTYLCGSARNVETTGIQDFKKLCSDSGLFEFVEGHANAFGFEIEIGNFYQFIDEVEETMKTIESYKPLVDFSLSGDEEYEWLLDVFREVDEYKECWGKGIEEPKFHFFDIEVPIKDITVGKTGNVSFEYNGIKYVKFFTKEDDSIRTIVDDWGISEDDILDIEVIGSIGMNEYKGLKTPQVIVDEWVATRIATIDDGWD